MGKLLSRFLNRITRTKSQEEDDGTEVNFLRFSRNLTLLKSIQLLTGACFNCAVFVVVGLAVKKVAGPAMVLSVILGAVIGLLNNMALTELCTRFPTATSFYSIMYHNVGELCAFVVGWFRLLQNILMISLVSITAGEYIYYMAQPPSDTSWLPSHTPWAEVELDTLVFTVAFLSIISLLIAAGLPHFTCYITTLFWTNVAVFLFMLIVIIYYASSLDWFVPSEFQPFDIGGTMQGVGITTFFFTYVDKIVEHASYMKQADYMVPISLAFSLLFVFLFYLCTTLFVTMLVPIDILSEKVQIPKEFAMATFHDAKYVLSSAALIIFCLTMVESYFGSQKLLNLLAQDGLLFGKFVNQPYAKKRVPPLSVLVVGALSIPLFIWLPVECLIQSFCMLSLLISITINCATIVVQYQPAKENNTEETSAFPNWKCTKDMIIRFILCFGYVTHRRVLTAFGVEQEDVPNQQTSKIVNWSVVSYVPSCIGLSWAMFHGLPVIGWKRWIVLGAVGLLTITLFFTIRIILIQPRGKACLFESNLLASLIPLINIGLFTILLAAMDWMAFTMVGVWLALGIVHYFFYGISHSKEAFFNRSQELNNKVQDRVRFDSAPQLLTNLRSIQPENTDADEQFLFSEDTHLLNLPPKY